MNVLLLAVKEELNDLEHVSRTLTKALGSRIGFQEEAHTKN